MYTFFAKFLAIAFLVVFALPLLLVLFMVEGMNFATLELLGRPAWNVGHVYEMWNAAEAMKYMKKMKGLASMLQTAASEKAPRTYN
jgi:hypothetical protein